MDKMNKKVSEIEATVGRSGTEGSSGRVYVPKDWIGKRVKVRLIK